jgi:hypothetical protein
MKSLVLFVFGVMATFFVLSNQKEINGIKNQFLKDFALSEEKEFTYDDYDPSNDERFSEEERTYFSKIVKRSEYHGSVPIGRWKTDMKIYVMGQKPDFLLEELNRIVGELNEIINPINIEIVDSEQESNFVILMDSQDTYNDFDSYSKKFTENNWGLFIVNAGEDIHEGSMYIDVFRCESIEGQKHLLREELTQSLGLKNDSYDYPESIFYQGWTETTEYAPIDRKLIGMLYNYI